MLVLVLVLLSGPASAPVSVLASSLVERPPRQVAVLSVSSPSQGFRSQSCRPELLASVLVSVPVLVEQLSG